MANLDLPVGKLNADYFQTPHPTPDLDPAQAIIDAFDGAKETIHFGIYSLTHAHIADALIRAVKRGVQVIGVADAVQAAGRGSQVFRVHGGGVDLRTWGSSGRLMHDKVFVIDVAGKSPKAGLGSFNWSTQAETSNTEVLLVVRGVQVGRLLGPALVSQIEAAYEGGNIVTYPA